MASHAVLSPVVEFVLSKLKGVEDRGRSGEAWRALCPVHDDTSPSLDIDIGRDGRVLLVCRTGCDNKAIVAAAGLSLSDLYPEKSTNGAHPPMHAPPKREPQTKGKKPKSDDDPRSAWPIVQTWNYVDADGEVLFQACRKESKVQRENGKPKKTFTQRRKGVGEWIWDLNGIDERPMYRLPELLDDLAQDRTILLVEGEKCADAVRELGFAATTHVCGSGGWRDEYAKQLAGASVVILPDNDDPGRKWAAEAGAALLETGARVRMLALPIADPHGDVADWIERGGVRAQLERLLARAVPWQTGDPVPLPLEAPKFKLLSVRDLKDLPPLEWLVGEDDAEMFATASLFALIGLPSAGKSFIAADLACAIASRRGAQGPLFLGNTVQHGPVLYVVAEGHRGFRYRVEAWQKHYEHSDEDLESLKFITEPVNLFGPDDISHLLRTADLLPEPPVLVVLDTLARSMTGGDENSAQDMGLVLDRADRVKRELGAAVGLVHHTRRDGDAERGSGAFRGSLDTMCLVRENEEGGRVLSCEKQKDAEPFLPITFYLSPVAPSCVVSLQATTKSSALTANQRAALQTLADVFPKGATSTEWLRSAGVSDRSFYRVKQWLVSNGYVGEREAGNTMRYTMQPSGHWALHGHIT